MTASRQYQNDLVAALSRFFPGEAGMEYFIPKKAKDKFAGLKGVYIPRLDVAVGTLGEIEGNQYERIREFYFAKAPQMLKRITGRLRENENPRCALGIEVVYSGTSKHILGDMVNSGTIGLYGLVLASDEMFPKVKRIQEYVRIVKDLGKMPVELCSNVQVLKAKEFLDDLRNSTAPIGHI